MPVHGDNFDRRAASHFSRDPELHVEQRQNSAQQVHTVRAGENVKKTAAGIGGQKNSLRGELAPGDDLAGNEKNAENRAGGPPVAEPSFVFRSEATVRTRERKAASD